MAAPRKILICEDEDAIREFEVINLQRSGYEVVDVSCGEDAIRVFDEQGDSFSVAILDIMMPGIDGFTVCKHIRETNNTLGIIMLSAKSQEMDKVNGLMLGADDYITKPFSPSELVARVDAVYRRVSMSSAKQEPENELRSGPFLLNIRSRSLSDPRRTEDRPDPGGIPADGTFYAQSQCGAGPQFAADHRVGRQLLRGR